MQRPSCLLLAALTLLTSALVSVPRAAANCLRVGICQEDFNSFNAVTWSGNGFVLAGAAKTSSGSGLALLRLSPDGQAQARFPLPLPQNLPPGSKSAEVRKLLTLPNGTLVLINNIQTAAPPGRTIGWVAAIAPNGKIWNTLLSDPSANVLLHSAYYDERSDRIIVVGRKQLGPDNGRCDNWSQSYIQGVRGLDGQMTLPSISEGAKGRGPINRQAIFDIAGDEKSGIFVFTGFITVPKQDGTCQDAVMVGRLVDENGKWQLANVNTLGSKEGNEGGFSIKSVGRGSYLLAGYGRYLDAPAAQVYRVKLDPSFGVEGYGSFPYPYDGSDKDGGDRFRVISPIEDDTHFVLAGSVSAGAKEPNFATWRIVTSDLEEARAPVVFNEPGGSDIFDAVRSPDGLVLAVGNAPANSSTHIGWYGFIGNSVDAAPVSRRRIDLSLPRLTSLPFTQGKYTLSETAGNLSSSYLQEDMDKGGQVDVAFTLKQTKIIRISAVAGSGDVDLVLTDESNQIVSFSNFGNVHFEKARFI